MPFSPVFPLIGIGLCVHPMLDLDGATWLRLAAWLAIGLAICFLYGRRHSRLRAG